MWWLVLASLTSRRGKGFLKLFFFFFSLNKNDSNNNNKEIETEFVSFSIYPGQKVKQFKELGSVKHVTFLSFKTGQRFQIMRMRCHIAVFVDDRLCWFLWHVLAVCLLEKFFFCCCCLFGWFFFFFWVDYQRSRKKRKKERSKTHKMLKRTLFNRTKQDKICKFSRKSSLSKLRTTQQQTNNSLIFCHLDAWMLAEGRVFETEVMYVDSKKRIFSKTRAPTWKAACRLKANIWNCLWTASWNMPGLRHRLAWFQWLLNLICVARRQF